MATTSLWKIKGRLKDLMEYVENPAKTQKAELQDFFNAMEYARNPEKTEQGYRSGSSHGLPHITYTAEERK